MTITPGSIIMQPCLPSGVNGSVQFNSSGALAGDSNFLWDHTDGLALTASVPTGKALQVNGVSVFIGDTNQDSKAYMLGGVYDAVTQGTSTSSGLVFSGYSVVQSPSNYAPTMNGGYIQLTPITYNPYNGSACTDQWGNAVQQPLPVLNGTFGSHDSILWVGTSPSMPDNSSCGTPLPGHVDDGYGLNTNHYFFARGGLATDNVSFNSIHALSGGVTAISFTAGGLYPAGTATHCCGTLATAAYIGGYVQVGHSATPPAAGTVATVDNPLTSGDGLNAGTMYFDDTLSCLNVFNGTTWNCAGGGGGGGGTPGGGNTQIQFNNSGAFDGSASLTWASSQLTVTGTVQATVGFNSTGVTANTIQATSGGVTGKWLTASDSMFLLEEAPPALSASSQTRLYSNSTTHQIMASKNGGAYVRVATNTGALTTGNCASFDGDGNVVDAGGPCSTGGGGGTVSSAAQKAVAYYTTAGTGTTVGGSSHFYWDNTAQLLTIDALNATSTGVVVSTGFMQADQGFLATSSVAVKYNVIQAPTGGMAALSFTASKYVQTGNGAADPSPTTSDTIHAGALYYDTVIGCEKVYNGAAWVCLGGGGSSGSPGGPLNSIQMNIAGSFLGYSNLLWDASVPTNPMLVTHYTDSSYLGQNFITSYVGAVSGHISWSLSAPSGTGIFRLSNGTGSGGLDGSGAQIYGTASDGILQAAEMKSWNTGTNYTFANANSTFLVDGNGSVSATGVYASTGVAGGFNVTNNTAYNSIQSVGGINIASGGSSSATYRMNGSIVIDSSHNFTGANVTVPGYADAATGFRVSGVSAIDSSRAGSFSAVGVLGSSAGNVVAVINSNPSGIGILDYSATGSSFNRLIMRGAPTSCTGQPTGMLWNNGGAVGICP